VNHLTLKNITINLPSIYCEAIDKLIENKLIASRSEAVRIALRDYLKIDFEQRDKIEYYAKRTMTESERIERDAKIQKMLNQNKKTREIMKEIGCTQNMVTRVRTNINGSVR
jgi:Arc/MetJ-type ribon-helix-helix transcriptional regulator